MGYIPIKDKLEEIERRGRQIRRRQEKLKDDAAFLADMLLTRATSDMEHSAACFANGKRR